MATYATLSEALTDIASRSFYESARVSKTDDGYVVEDWYTDVEEYAWWTYQGGAEVGDVLDYSRTHEPNEFYDRGSHVEYNLPVAVETVEEGTPVGFTHVVAQAECEHEEWEGCEEDHTVGWLLIATVEA